MKQILAVIAIVLGFTSLAHAGFLLEPSIGYESGTTTYKGTSGTSTSSKTSALDVGLRLGYRNMGFWVGVDGGTAFSGKSKPDSGDSLDYTLTTAYLAFGYDFPSRLRAWAGIGLIDSFLVKASDSGSVDTTYSGGTPFKVGIGYAATNHISLNVEFVMHTYKKLKTGSSEFDLSDFGLESVKNNTAILSVSFPFSF